MRVLLFQSEPLVRDVLGAFLREAGHEVLATTAAAEALAACAEGGIDLVFVDLGPEHERDGSVMAEMLRATQPDLALVCALTDDAMAVSGDRTATVRKPYRISRVLATIEALLTRPQAAAAPARAPSGLADGVAL